MLSPEERESAIKSSEELKLKIKAIREELDKISSEKESWYSKKESYKSQIATILNNVKSLKQERNDLTKQVQVSKTERELVEHKLPELQNKIENLKKQRETLSAKFGQRFDYGKLRREIEALTQKIETMPMSFENEKKTMVMIKAKRKELKSADEINTLSKQIREIAQEIDVFRNIRNISHSKVQSIARNSQEKHVGMVTEAQKIDELKALEHEAFEKFKDLKTKFKDKSLELKDLQKSLSDTNKALGFEREEVAKVRHSEQRKSLEDKRKIVQERFMKGEKLSTDDLLILQTSDDDSD
jgi:uncharacterized coiled-coil DUF342 family protein